MFNPGISQNGETCYITALNMLAQPVKILISKVKITIVFYNLTPLAVSIVTPVSCLYYIRRHSISGDTIYKKAISRLALFLVTGNAVNVVGNLLIILTAALSNASASVYFLYGVGVLSLFPAPIFIIMFLKAVRDQMRAIITCHRSHSHQVQPQVPVEKWQTAIIIHPFIMYFHPSSIHWSLYQTHNTIAYYAHTKK